MRKNKINIREKTLRLQVQTFSAVEFANLEAEGAAALEARLIPAAADEDAECAACAERLWAAVRPLGSIRGGCDDSSCARL